MVGVSESPRRTGPGAGQIAPDAAEAWQLATPLPEGPPSGRIASVCHWLTARGLEAVPVEQLIDGLIPLLDQAGFAISRLNISGSSLHPEFVGFTNTWWRDRPDMEVEKFQGGSDVNPEFAASPMALILSSERPVLRLNPPDPAVGRRFPMMADYAAQGSTDYLLEKIGFGFGAPAAMNEMIGIVTSWMTDAPGGFTDQEVVDLRAVSANLALAVRARGDLETVDTLLSVYLGADAGQRVAKGHIRRGDVVSIRAAILYADLRGFTAVSTQLPTPDLVELVNEYFGRIVGCLADEGGEVLKFIGDGVLAIFPLGEAGENEPRLVAARALEAAKQAVAAVEEVNAGRAGGPACPGLDIALHAGELLYGNIGAPRRLDFTVIGPAVNAISRLEPLCQALSAPIIISEDFARHGGPGLAVRSLGHHDLRGMDAPMEIFAPA